MFNIFRKKQDISFENSIGKFKYIPKRNALQVVFSDFPELEVLVRYSGEISSADDLANSSIMASLDLFKASILTLKQKSYLVIENTIHNDEERENFKFMSNEEEYFALVEIFVLDFDKQDYVFIFEDLGKLVPEMKGYYWKVYFKNGKEDEFASIDS